MLDFYDLDQVYVVDGGPSVLLDELTAGTVPLESIAAAAVVRGPDEIQLFSVEELEALLDRAEYGEDMLAAMLQRGSATIVAAGATPREPAVVLEEGSVAGAWMAPAPTPQTRHIPSPRRRGNGGTAAAPAAESALSPAIDETIRRTPHLDAPAAIATAPGTTFSVEVYTDARAFDADEEGRGVEIDAPPEVKDVDVRVLLVVSDHFEVDDEGDAVLTIRRDEERSEPVQFTVKVAADPPSRTAGIQAVFLRKGRTCGHVGRAWDWHNDRSEAMPAAAQPAAAVSLPVHFGAKQPELSVYVVAPVNDGVHYQCAVETSLIPGYDRATTEPWGIDQQRHAYVSRLFDAITDEERSDDDRLSALSEAGYEIWEAAPPIFKRVLWALVDANRRPKSIYIASAEPTLPWELMIPTRHDGKTPDELEPLGVEFAIGRWTRGDAASPPPAVPVGSACVVAPSYRGRRKLEARGEIEFIQERFNGRFVSPSTIDHLDTWFETNHASLLHFVCHGAADVEDDDALYMEDEEVLRSRRLRTLKGLKAMCKQHRPLVFVNACDTGRLTPSLAGGAGFPRAFGDIGARAVIAPLWPVDDKQAHDVAINLYRAALEPDSPALAELLRRIRKQAYDKQDNDTYAAYCFFGDPTAKLTYTGS